MDGADHGYHLFGSARPYYGTQSRVSSSGTDGRLMLTSDTSRLFAVGSGGTVLLGDPNIITLGSPNIISSGAQRYVWVQEWGTAATDANGRINGYTFNNSGFSGVPFVHVTVGPSSGAVVNAAVVVDVITPSTMSLVVFNSASVGVANQTVTIMSLGTRTL